MQLDPDPFKILGSILGDVTKMLPPEVVTAINGTVGQILDPANGTVGPGDPQPAGPPPIPVAPGTPEHASTRATLDALVKVLNGVLAYGGALIPDQYEVYLKDLVEALVTIEGWL